MTSEPTPSWKTLRLMSGLSQREIGRRANINSGRLSIIERGVTPTDEEAARLRAVLTAAINTPRAIA